MREWLKRNVLRLMVKFSKIYRQPDFLQGRLLIHEDLTDFDRRLAIYEGSEPAVRRAARLLLEREIERRRPGKADAIRAVVIATLTSIAIVAVGTWSGWSTALFGIVADSAGEDLTSALLSQTFADALMPTFWAFSVVVIVLLLILYPWAISSSGSDKKRGTYVAWLAAFRESEERRRPRPRLLDLVFGTKIARGSRPRRQRIEP